MQKEIYIFSGLGADEHVIQKLDFSGFSVTHVKWIIPDKNETIEKYTTRLLPQITTSTPTLIGLSFGGMIAIEVAKQMETSKLILISSAKSKKEIPFYFRMAGKLRMHQLLPAKLLKNSSFITNWFFGAKTTFDKKLLKQILIDTDPIFLKWAIDKIVRWKNQQKINNTFHIHGTNDKILPLHFIKPDIRIKKGGHLMILNQFEEINTIIKQQL